MCVYVRMSVFVWACAHTCVCGRAYGYKYEFFLESMCISMAVGSNPHCDHNTCNTHYDSFEYIHNTNSRIGNTGVLDLEFLI